MTLIDREHIDTSWQISEQRMPDDVWDAAIVGGGPAGSMAAFHLARRGHRVILLEKHRFPREKVCGDALLPDALTELDSAGLGSAIRARGFPVSHMKVFSSGGVPFDVPGEMIVLRRAVTDLLIARHASTTGAVICQAEVNRITSRESELAEISLQGSNRVVRTRHAIIATGAQVHLAHKLGLVSGLAPTALAVRCYVRSSIDLSYPVLSYGKAIRPGYAWIFPLGNGLFNVGCGMLLQKPGVQAGSRLREIYREFVNTFPLAQEIVGQGTQVAPLTGAALTCGLPTANKSVDGPVLAAGETIGTTFPFTGEGIGTAMVSARLAADAIHEALKTGDTTALSSYASGLDRYLRPNFAGYEAAQRWLAVPWVSDLVARRIQKSRYLREACRGIILGTVNPRSVYSLSGVLRSFWS